MLELLGVKSVEVVEVVSCVIVKGEVVLADVVDVSGPGGVNKVVVVETSALALEELDC